MLKHAIISSRVVGKFEDDAYLAWEGDTYEQGIQAIVSSKLHTTHTLSLYRYDLTGQRLLAVRDGGRVYLAKEKDEET